MFNNQFDQPYDDPDGLQTDRYTINSDWGNTIAALLVTVVLGAQCLLMRPLLTQPMQKAPWYNARGVSLYVLGMMVTAVALAGRSLL